MSGPAALNRGAMRWARGTFVGLATVWLGLAAHTMAGGTLLTIGPLTVLTGFGVAGGVVLSGRRWTAGPLLTLFLLCQAGVHVVSMDQMAAGNHSAMAMGGPPAMPMNIHAMVLSHALAAVVLMVVVLWGEAALVALVEHFVLRAARLRRIILATGETLGHTLVSTRIVRLLIHDAGSRAPPLLAL